MLFGASKDVIHGAGGSSGHQSHRVARGDERVRIDAEETLSDPKLDLLAEVWARQTGRTVVVAPAARV